MNMAQDGDGIWQRGLFAVMEFISNFMVMAEEEFDGIAFGPLVDMIRRQKAPGVKLVGLGIFLACLGFFFIGIGFIWGVSVWVKHKEKK